MSGRKPSDAEVTRQIMAALRARYKEGKRDRFLYAEEVPLSTGYSANRLDAVVMHCWPSEGFLVEGFEVKASVSDLRRELENGGKHEAEYPYLDRFWLACPPEILRNGLLDALPKKWGVLALQQDGTLKSRRNALALHDSTPDTIRRSFAASFMRKAGTWSAGDEDLDRARNEGFKEGKEYAQREAERTIGVELEKVKGYDRLLEAVVDAPRNDYYFSDYELDMAIEKVRRLRVVETSDPQPLLWRLKNLKTDLDAFLERYERTPMAEAGSDR